MSNFSARSRPARNSFFASSDEVVTGIFPLSEATLPSSVRTTSERRRHGQDHQQEERQETLRCIAYSFCIGELIDDLYSRKLHRIVLRQVWGEGLKSTIPFASRTSFRRQSSSI